MGLLKWAIIVASLAALYQWRKSPSLPLHVDGWVDPKFKTVQKLFRQNFEDGWEVAGAALAVFHEGRLVVDLHGGYADGDAMRRWEKDTMTVIWSSTKALTSLAMAKLVDDGHCQYDELVVKYWPQFGRHGKDNLTIGMVMSHQAGLAAIDEEITMEDVADLDRMGDILANQVPNWAPGRDVGYHAMTFGFVVSQIIRRVDPKKRSLRAYLREEIMDKVGAGDDCHVGMPLELEHRVARMTFAGVKDLVATMTQSWASFINLMKFLYNRPALLSKVAANPHFTFGGTDRHRIGYNNPAVHGLEIGAAGGICTARGLAAPFNALLQGKVLSKKMLHHLAEPLFIARRDLVLGLPLTLGMGFMYSKNPKNDSWIIGHSGFGDQYVAYDTTHHLAFAYVNNGLKAGFKESAFVSKGLIREIYKCVEA